jgi:hypothetical protein
MQLNAAGCSLDIINYWAIKNGSYQDFVGGDKYTLIPQQCVILFPDRFGKDVRGAFKTAVGCLVRAPAGFYFTTGSFSITMWTVMTHSAAVHMIQFGNGDWSDNVHVVTNNPGVCSHSTYFQILSGASYNLACSSSRFEKGVWYHFAITYDVTSLTSTIYVNGKFVGGSSGQQQLRNLTRSNNYFGHDWMFDEVKIHGRSLSAKEVWSDFVYNQSYVL